MNGLTPLTRLAAYEADTEVNQRPEREQIIAWTRCHAQETLRNAWQTADATRADTRSKLRS